MDNNVKVYPVQINSIKKQETTLPNILQIGAVNKWKKYVTGKNVVVSVIDTGIDQMHPNLKGQIIGGYNFTNDYNGDILKYHDTNGHGTHVAGIIAGRLLEENILTGVAPKVKILALKVINNKGSGTVDALIKAIEYSINWRGPQGEKVGVINISLGVKRSDSLLHRAIKRAINSNIPVVAASGNDGDGDVRSEEYQYPGAFYEVIEVGALDHNNEIASFTSTNKEIDLFAPGVNILSAYLDGELMGLSGTSMAAPHVTGAIALLIEESVKSGECSINEKDIFKKLCQNTKSIGLEKEIEGYGSLYLRS
jgi:major intracellular serine protease